MQGRGALCVASRRKDFGSVGGLGGRGKGFPRESVREGILTPDCRDVSN